MNLLTRGEKGSSATRDIALNMACVEERAYEEGRGMKRKTPSERESRGNSGAVEERAEREKRRGRRIDTSTHGIGYTSAFCGAEGKVRRDDSQRIGRSRRSRRGRGGRRRR